MDKNRIYKIRLDSGMELTCIARSNEELDRLTSILCGSLDDEEKYIRGAQVKVRDLDAPVFVVVDKVEAVFWS